MSKVTSLFVKNDYTTDGCKVGNTFDLFDKHKQLYYFDVRELT